MTDSWQQLIALAERSWQTYGQEYTQGNVRVTRSTVALDSIRTVYRPSLCVVLSGAKQTCLGDTIIQYQAGHCLFTSVDVPVTARLVQASEQQPFLAVSLALEPRQISDLIELATPLPEPTSAALALHRAQIPRDLIDPLARLLALNFASDDVPIIKPLIEREIAWRLLHSPLAVQVRQLGLDDSHTARIAKATRWLRAHYNEPVRVPELAALSSMSVASFHRHFKAITQMTPVQYQKQIRLQEARQRLLLESNVAQIGLGVGYESASQFSREYRRFFGLSPGQDRKQLLDQANMSMA